MTYLQNKELFTAMDTIETYSRLRSHELDKVEPVWDSVQRYGDHIEAARSAIYNLMVQCND